MFLNLSTCSEPVGGTREDSTQQGELTVRYIRNGTLDPKYESVNYIQYIKFISKNSCHSHSSPMPFCMPHWSLWSV